jgi:hypothetical protein
MFTPAGSSLYNTSMLFEHGKRPVIVDGSADDIDMATLQQ